MKESQIPQVTVAGDRARAYVVREEHADGTLVLQPETEAQASLRRLGLQPMTDAEFAELAVDMQPPRQRGVASFRHPGVAHERLHG